jgi:hypothetical protein
MRLGLVVLATTIVIVPLIIIARAGTDYSRLEARYTSSKSETGIPGLWTWYEAHLVNGGRLPVRIQTCNFIDDTGSKGRVPAYSVQRFDPQTQRWTTVAGASDVRSCRPYPLGWIKTELKMSWLWPNHKISTGEEITAARGFHKGESARFVIYSGFHSSGKGASTAFATSAFTIDEEIEDDPSKFRVKH